MAISMDLRVLARKLEKSSDDLLVSASTKSPEVFQKVAMAVAAASSLLEGVACDMDSNASFEITPQQLDEIAALASAFDESGDPLLKKQASVLDELLLSIAAPKNALAISRKATEDEINRLRAERRKTRGEEAYDEPRQVLSEMENAKAQAKAVEQQVKRYVPMEAPLQTRYPPDRPGGQMTRITDHVYQDIVTGIIYDYKAGYKTQKGNEVPGGSVEAQTRELGDNRNQGSSLFETRESLMGRYASSEDQVVKIAGALKAIRDYAPALLERGIDRAMASGLSTSQVAEILASDISEQGLKAIAGEADEAGKKKREPLKSKIDHTPLSAEKSKLELYNSRKLLQALKESGWWDLVDDHLNIAGEFLQPEDLRALLDEFPRPLTGRPTIRPGTKDVPAAYSDTMLAGRIARESLIGLVINAVQELAPHLLKATIAKAQAEGLEDYQIKSVLASGFSNQFSKPSDEIKVAESLFPHLQDLGWNDLVEKHICVMAGLGVKKDDLQKIANQYGPVDVRSLSRLGRVLKEAATPAPVLDLGKLEPEKKPEPIQMPVQTIPFEPESGKYRVTAAELPLLVRRVVANIEAMLENPIEYQRYKKRYQGAELLELIMHDEYQKFRNDMGDEMFSAFANMVREAVLADPFLSPQAAAAPVAHVAPAAKEHILESPEEVEADEDVTNPAVHYDENSPEYEAIFADADKLVAEFFETNPSSKQALIDIRDAEKARAKKEYKLFDEDNNKAIHIFNEIVKITADKIMDGEEEIDVGEIFESILAENRKVKHGPFNPKAQQKELTKGVDESQEHFETRVKNLNAPAAKEINKVDPSTLSNETPAKNGTLLWEDYQNATGEEVSEAQAYQLESKIKARKLAEEKVVEQIFGNFPHDKPKAPQFINELPDAIRSDTIDRARKENAYALIRYLNDKKTADTSLAFPLPSLSEARDACIFYGSQGAQKLKSIDEFHKQVRSRITRRTANSALDEAGLMPMFANEPGDSISNEEIRDHLQELMGEKRAKEPFVKPIPIGPQGTRLTPFWEDPEGYTSKFQLAQMIYENPFGKGSKNLPQSVRDQQDDYMVTEGFVSPSDKLFGRTNTRQMLRGADGAVGNVLADFEKPGTDEQYKTLFSDPDEYTKAYFDTRTRTAFRDKPKEWMEIMGTDGPGLSDIPRTVKEKIWPLVMKGLKINEIIDQAATKGISADVVGRIVDYAKNSGNKIRGLIQHLALKENPASLDEVKAELEKNFPGANASGPVIEYVYYNILADKEDTKESKDAQDKAMAELGFYPPHQIAVGSSVTFGDILSPRKKGRGGFTPTDAEPLEQLKKNPQGKPASRPSIKSKVNAPKSKPAQRQPGSPTVENRTGKLESLLKGKK